jgi:hypothetical protein
MSLPTEDVRILTLLQVGRIERDLSSQLECLARFVGSLVNQKWSMRERTVRVDLEIAVPHLRSQRPWQASLKDRQAVAVKRGILVSDSVAPPK